MPRRTALVPFQQGDLDGLCGIYSVINAIRLATEDETRDLPDAALQELFFTLLLEADAVVGRVEAVGLGIDPQPLFRVAQAAVRHMADEHGLQLTVTHALRRGEPRTFDTILRRLTELSQQPRSAVLICLTGQLDHWTVLRRVTGQSLTFLTAAVALASASRIAIVDGPARLAGRISSSREESSWYEAAEAGEEGCARTSSGVQVVG